MRWRRACFAAVRAGITGAVVVWLLRLLCGAAAAITVASRCP